ncbi:MAG: ABC transporter permease [Dehalococcoidales bacterium]
MSLRRVSVLLRKELLQGPKNFIFIMAVVAPILISLVFSLVFGTLFTEKPKLGIVDEGDSQLVAMVQKLDAVITKEYATIPEIKQATESGAVDMGIVLPENFDTAVTRGETVTIEAYIWGESLAKNRTILPVTIADLVRKLGGQEVPVEIESVTLGDEVSIPWSDRLLPLLVLMAVFLGGLMLPATSIIDEKQKKTLEALVITPTTIGDVFVAKGILGVILSLFMGVAILVLNQAFGTQPLLLVLVLLLGSIMAVELGLLAGALIKDITTLFAIWKFGGILLFGPAIVYMFPQIPEWVGRIFPTYYAIQPVVAISQGGGGWPDIATSVFILIGLNLALAGVVMFSARKTLRYAV